MRIAELQVQLRLVPPKGPVSFACNNQPADQFVATFFDTDPPAASVERGDRTVIAYQVQTPSGAKYEGQNLSLRTKGNEATITWLGEEMTCKAL
jgi:membrane-bound inhibitor of C-type lysozyme